MNVSKKWINQRRNELLSKSSGAEKKAYDMLMSLGLKTVKQYPIITGKKIYFADLYIPEYQLILEIDGGYHETINQKRLDKNRSQGLWRLGYHVCRIKNNELKNIDAIIAIIKRYEHKKQ